MKIDYHLLTIFEHDQTRNQRTKINTPKTIDQNSNCSRACSYLSIGHSNVTSPQIAEIATEYFSAKTFNMKIDKKKVRIQLPLVNPIIELIWPLEKVLKIDECTVIKCHNNPNDNDSGSYDIDLPHYGG